MLFLSLVLVPNKILDHFNVIDLKDYTVNLKNQNGSSRISILKKWLF